MYVCDKRNCLRNLSRASKYHLNMTEHAMHFWRVGGILEGHKTSLQNREEPSQGFPFPSNTTISTRVPNLSFAETIFRIEFAPGASGRRPMLWPNQKPILLMSFIIRNISRGVDMVLDPYRDTGVKEKPCQLDPRHRNFADCDADSEFVVRLMPPF